VKREYNFSLLDQIVHPRHISINKLIYIVRIV